MTRPFAFRLAWLLLLALVTLPSASWSQEESPAEPIGIGAVFNLTGPQSSLGQPSLNGAILAVEQINAAGGLLGRLVELIALDGKTDPSTVARATRTLVRNRAVSAIVGLSDTTMALAAAPIAEAARTVFLTSGATSPLVPIQFPKDYFMACFGDNTQAAAGAEYAFSVLGARRVYLLFDDTQDYTRLLAGYFKARYLELGGRLVGDDRYTGGSTDFSPQIARLKALGTPPDLLYISSGPDDIGLLVKQLRDAGVDVPIFGGDGYDTPLLIQVAGAAANDVYFTTHALLDPAQATPLQKEFIDAYQVRFGTPPESAFAGLGYDAVNLVAAAIERAGLTRRKAIPGALEATRNLPGVTGNISFARGVHIPSKQVTIVRIVNGELTLEAIVTPVKVPPPVPVPAP